MQSFSGLSLDERKLIVGIDFGTTFSGVAWAETRRSDHQSVIESWPANPGSHEGSSSVKVPTELRYTPQGIEWGFQIPAITERFQWFKLDLGEGKATAGPTNKSSEELTTDYLRELNKHLMYFLEQKLGAAVLRTTPIEFVLTVPAIWTEVAKERTLRACQKAGLKSQSEILLVSEPEAAAIYALHGLDPHGLNIGDSFVLCDAGGGTVDLISYTITQLHPILKVKEAAAGTGGLCGSTFLNRRFGEFLTQKLGNEPGWDEEILAEAMDRFDSVIKKQYSPSTSNQDGYSIMVPGIANNERLGIRRGRFTIKPAEMKSIFDPVIEKIIDLVKGQIKATNKKIRAVLLVGGFGQNIYLRERLNNNLSGSIQVLQPVNAWTAVVRGAVMMGLANTNSKLAAVRMESRAARKHYGIELHFPFDATKHEDGKKFWCAKDQFYRVNALSWFIKKGEAVEESKPHEIPFVAHFLVSAGQPTSVKLQVYCDEHSAIAPVHKNQNGRDLVALEANFAQLPRAGIPTERCNDGNMYYVVSGCVEATHYSASTKYVLMCQGKRYDTVTAEYV